MKTARFALIIFLLSFNSLLSKTIYPPLPVSASGAPEIRTSSPYSDYEIFPSQYFQIETSVTFNQNVPGIIFASAITGDAVSPGYYTGVYVTTNNGLNWSGTDAIRDFSNNIIYTVGDPISIIDKNGVLILTYITFPLSGSNLKVGSSYSTNNGLSWSATYRVPGVNFADKVVSCTDDVSSSPYYGRSYLIYNEGNTGVFFSSTTNSAVSWATAKRISPTPFYPRIGGNISTNNSGLIFVSWPTPFHTIGIAKSTNGGNNWTSSDNSISAFPIADTSFVFLFNNQKVNGLPALAIDKSGGERNGWIYVVSSQRQTANSPATDLCDLILNRSTNNAVSWDSKLKRVNQDNTGSLKYQFFPAVNIDNYGGINILYFDTRDTPSNDSCNVYLSRSLDGGNSFYDEKISQSKFKPKAIQDLYGLQVYAGSYIGITSANGNLFPVWYDDHTGLYKASSAVIPIAPIINIKLIPQGFYNPGSGKLNSKDTVRIYLRNSGAPYALADSSLAVMDSVSFSAYVSFKNAVTGNYFYQIKHRNSLETWSSNAVYYQSNSNSSYDFTVSDTTAFGNNLILTGSKFCIYSGDINHDGVVDATDASITDNAAYNNFTGYVTEDCNGDYFVDGTDLAIVDNNLLNSVTKITP